ncbi:hypothetical protein BC827DRAFT_1187634 [Russula dissimulans]|nr:hypothetical protein BC827DRAFT_1187634 [Russula dissimulans]
MDIKPPIPRRATCSPRYRVIPTSTSAPPSRLTSGTSAIPETTAGMPRISPENVALPPS